jgi:hypothetical protein
MVTLDTKHKLSKAEISVLRQLIGKSLAAIICSGADLTSLYPYYDFIDTVNLRFKGDKGFISISALIDETSFGEDFIKIFIKQEKDAIGIKRHEQGGLQHPFVHLNVHPEFVVKKIEVYGDSYVCQSDNLETKRYWRIEIDNPGQPITENIETENAILFYSDNHRLLIRPYGAVPWIQVSFDNKFIDDSLICEDNEGKTITKLKHDLK